MDKTVELVNEWAKFKEQHTDGKIEDFCRHYLINKRENKKGDETLVGGIIPPNKRILLMKTIGRIVKIFLGYANTAIETTQLRQFEEFNFLNIIYQLKNPKKTEAITQALCELSTGIDILNRMKKDELIEEQDDPTDRRSKRVTVTPKGEKILFSCYNVFGRINLMMLDDMSDDDVLLCIQLLKGVEMKYATLWQQHKNKKFEEICAEMNCPLLADDHEKAKEV